MPEDAAEDRTGRDDRAREGRAVSVVGFVGLGTMGGRIAGRLLASGHQVHATNRTVEKAKPLIAPGA